MRIIIYIKNHNLASGNISLKKEHIAAYWNGLIESIEVYSADKIHQESYYGEGLERLMLTVQKPSSDAGYYLAKRWIEKE